MTGKRSNEFSRRSKNIRDAIDRAVKTILADNPDPLIQTRIIQDDDPKHRSQILKKPAVKRLATQQHRAGNWGGLHCGRRWRQLEVRNTETGVERALVLGFNHHDPLLRRTQRYLADLLRGRREFPEREKNDRYIPGWTLFAAATLARIDPNHLAIDKPFDIWRDILLRTFKDGRFNAAREVAAHRELHNIQNDIRYLELRNKYAVYLLGSRVEQLPPRIESAYMN